METLPTYPPQGVNLDNMSISEEEYKELRLTLAKAMLFMSECTALDRIIQKIEEQLPDE
jgi:hypothetical protein